MYKSIIGAALIIGSIAPVSAAAEVLTTQIGDKTVTYVVTSPYRGHGWGGWGGGDGPTREQILERIRQSKPLNLTVKPNASPGSEQLTPGPEKPQ